MLSRTYPDIGASVFGAVIRSRSRPCAGILVSYRAKSKLARDPKIRVRLLTDIPKYGRKGAAVDVSRGQMRNRWYPHRLAAYIVGRKSAWPPVTVDTPQDAVKEQLKDVIDNALDKKELEAQLPTASSILASLDQILPAALLIHKSRVSPDSNEFHGSVTAQEVANIIRNLALENQQSEGHLETGRIALENDSVSILSTSDESKVVVGKVKEFGVYSLEIRLPGLNRVIHRRLDVAIEPQSMV